MAYLYYIILLTNIVLLFLSAIFHAKCFLGTELEIFVIFWAL